ncbi:hypothetical protein [Metabacillus litoralis]|uniref:hypothetical protein n=1 Tax=Metabacillus litoralis TaxID=152268 RepID=UPI00203E9649|nr:hypothetical protein [Metabacillus litoralis]MCM3413538.1 hypothetical protein [Metabacillus litoralis]
MTLKENEIEQVAAVAVRTALEYLEKERESQKKLKQDRRLRNIKLLLRHYRSFKMHYEATKEDLKELDEYLELDEFGDNELAIEAIKRSKKRTASMVKFIDKMIGIFKIMCEQSEKEEDKRIYQSVYYLYISEVKLSAKDISERHNTDPRTVYKDVEKACKTLSSLIFGVDSIRF